MTKFVPEKSHIKCSDTETPFFHIMLGDNTYQFSIAEFPRDKHEWLQEVLERHMINIHERATLAESDRIKSEFKKLFGFSISHP